MKVKMFYHKPTFTLSYVVYDLSTKDAVVIDPAIDYSPNSSQYGFAPVQEIHQFLDENKLKLHYILETHAHADHITGAQWLKEKHPSAKVGIHKNILQVQAVFKEVFNFSDSQVNPKAFDIYLSEEEPLKAGALNIEIIHTPGHTPACASFYINKSIVFTGDALFMPDYGTGRCDFPKGSAKDLFMSVSKKLYALPDDTIYYTGHDYQPNGRELMYQSTIAESKKNNIRLNAETTEEDFVKLREQRDSELEAPRLILPSIQLNINAGRFPQKESNGKMYLKIPFVGPEPS